jgi:hypothetical protein
MTIRAAASMRRLRSSSPLRLRVVSALRTQHYSTDSPERLSGAPP